MFPKPILPKKQTTRGKCLQRLGAEPAVGRGRGGCWGAGLAALTWGRGLSRAVCSRPVVVLRRLLDVRRNELLNTENICVSCLERDLPVSARVVESVWLTGIAVKHKRCG